MERIFVYRLSNRRITKNVFGIISVRFRVLRNSMELFPDRVQKTVCGIYALHNFLMSRSRSKAIYSQSGSFDVKNESGIISPGSWTKRNK